MAFGSHGMPISPPLSASSSARKSSSSDRQNDLSLVRSTADPRRGACIMVGTLIGIIVVLIVLGLIVWAVTQLLPLIPLPEPFARIIHVLIVLLCSLVVIWVILQILGSVVALPTWLHLK